jgi:hypothetical protein
MSARKALDEAERREAQAAAELRARASELRAEARALEARGEYVKALRAAKELVTIRPSRWASALVTRLEGKLKARAAEPPGGSAPTTP